MNKFDESMIALTHKEGEYNRYEHKDEWGIFDYIMGYGMPVVMFIGVLILFCSPWIN